jgi:DHA3 family tetracycline resistance protein-like MFS transporter
LSRPERLELTFMNRLSARTVWYAYEAIASFFWALVFTVTAYYFVTEVGMSPLELVLVGTVMELSVFVFEVPTGIVADTYSRRLSIVIGNVVMGLAFLLVAGLAEVAAILAAYAVWGLGWTFTSGAMDAWLADELGDERYSHVVLRGAQVGRAFTVLGICASVGLALVDLRLPILLGGLGTIALAGFYALAMPETGFRPLPRGERSSFATMAATAREGVRVVRGHRALLAILGIAAFGGMWSESYDRLWEAHLIVDVGLPDLGGLDPVVWFGILGVGGMLLSMAVAAPLGRQLAAAGRSELVRWLFSFDCVLVVASLAFALAGQFWLAICASYAIFVTRELAGPLLTIWLNRSIGDSNVRATVLSITNQADAIGQWTGGPAIGALGSVFSIRVALAAAAGCLLPALALYRRALRVDGAETAAAETAVEQVV